MSSVDSSAGCTDEDALWVDEPNKDHVFIWPEFAYPLNLIKKQLGVKDYLNLTSSCKGLQITGKDRWAPTIQLEMEICGQNITNVFGRVVPDPKNSILICKLIHEEDVWKKGYISRTLKEKFFSIFDLFSMAKSPINMAMDTLVISSGSSKGSNIDIRHVPHYLKTLNIRKIRFIRNFGDFDGALITELIQNFDVEHFLGFYSPTLRITSRSVVKIELRFFRENDDFAEFLECCPVADIKIASGELFIPQIRMFIQSWADDTRYIKHISFYARVSNDQVEQTVYSITLSNDKIHLTIGTGCFTLRKADGRAIKITHVELHEDDWCRTEPTTVIAQI